MTTKTFKQQKNILKKNILKMYFYFSQHDDQSDSTESLTTHPKAKEWLISASRANYQELAKLGHEYPPLVRLQVSVKKIHTCVYSLHNF
jgi:hypothetical protein